MPARILLPEEFLDQEPDTAIFETGGMDAVEFQDCANIIQAFERGAHSSASEAALFAPLARIAQNTKYWSKSGQDILGSWLIDAERKTDSTSSAHSTSGIEFDNTFSALKDQNFGEALKTALGDCIPCEDKLNLLLTFNPNTDFLSIFEDDIRRKIEALKNLDDLLSNLDSYGDICELLGFLNFMCIPDLQRMMSVLMALLQQGNDSLKSLFNLIAGLIVPLFAPILSGITNLLNQYAALVLSPINCVLDALRAQISKIPGNNESTNIQALKSGLLLIEEQLNQGVSTITSKLQFYTDQLRKLLGDWNGDTDLYITSAISKLQLIRTIGLIAAIIKLKRKGSDLCKPGTNPSVAELDNFLNPDSALKFTVDDNGDIRVEEPDPSLYQLEEPDNSAKIISYEPDDLLIKPVSAVFKCAALRADPSNVDKINRYINDINRLNNSIS